MASEQPVDMESQNEEMSFEELTEQVLEEYDVVDEVVEEDDVTADEIRAENGNEPNSDEVNGKMSEKVKEPSSDKVVAVKSVQSKKVPAKSKVLPKNAAVTLKSKKVPAKSVDTPKNAVETPKKVPAKSMVVPKNAVETPKTVPAKSMVVPKKAGETPKSKKVPVKSISVPKNQAESPKGKPKEVESKPIQKKAQPKMTESIVEKPETTAKKTVSTKTSTKTSQNKHPVQKDVVSKTGDNRTDPLKVCTILIYPFRVEDFEQPAIKAVLETNPSVLARFFAGRGKTKEGILDLRLQNPTSHNETLEKLSGLKLSGENQPTVLSLTESPSKFKEILTDLAKKLAEMEGDPAKDQPVSVFVNNIPVDTQVELLSFLYPSSRSIQLPVNSQGAVQGYAIIQFPNLQEARNVVENNKTYPAEIGGNVLNMYVIGHEEENTENEDKLQENQKKVDRIKTEDTIKKEPVKKDSIKTPDKAVKTRDRKRSGSKVDDRGDAKRPKAEDSKSPTRVRSETVDVFVGNATPGKSIALKKFLEQQLVKLGVCTAASNPIINLKTFPGKQFYFAVFRNIETAKKAARVLDGVNFETRRLNVRCRVDEDPKAESSKKDSAAGTTRRRSMERKDEREKSSTSDREDKLEVYLGDVPRCTSEEISEFVLSKFVSRGLCQADEKLIQRIKFRPRRTFQFIVFHREKHARASIRVLDNIVFKGSKIRAKFASTIPDSAKDRRSSSGSERDRRGDLLSDRERRASLLAEQERRASFMYDRERRASLLAEQDRRASIFAEQERRAILLAEQERESLLIEQQRRANLLAEQERRASLLADNVLAEQERRASLLAEQERRASLLAEQERRASLLAEQERRQSLARGSRRSGYGDRYGEVLDRSNNPSIGRSMDQPLNMPIGTTQMGMPTSGNFGLPMPQQMDAQSVAQHIGAPARQQLEIQQMRQQGNVQQPMGTGMPMNQPMGMNRVPNPQMNQFGIQSQDNSVESVEDKPGEYHVYFGNVPACRPAEFLDFIKKQFRGRGLCGENENPVKRLNFSPKRSYQFAVFANKYDAKAAGEELNGEVFKGSQLTAKANQVEESVSSSHQNKPLSAGRSGQNRQSAAEAATQSRVTQDFESKNYGNTSSFSTGSARSDDQRSRVYVGNLPVGVSRETLEISILGQLVNRGACRPDQNPIKRMDYTPLQTFLFLQFYNETDAKYAVQALDGIILEGRSLKVNFAKSPAGSKNSKEFKNTTTTSGQGAAYGVIVSNMPSSTTLEQFSAFVKNVFMQQGVCRLEDRIVQRYEFQLGRHYQYIVFLEEAHARVAIRVLNGLNFMGETLKVDQAFS